MNEGGRHTVAELLAIVPATPPVTVSFEKSHFLRRDALSTVLKPFQKAGPDDDLRMNTGFSRKRVDPQKYFASAQQKLEGVRKSSVEEEHSHYQSICTMQ